MKRLVFLSMIVAAIVACQPSSTKQMKSNMAEVDTKVVFKGTLPAADCPGIVYELTLEEEPLLMLDEKYYLFVLKKTYLEANNGRDTTFTLDGQAERIYVEAELPRGAYELLRLKNNNENVNFEILDDSTLCLLNADGDLPENQSLYYLHKVK